MFLSKLDALSLSKILFHYEKLMRHDSDEDELDFVFDLSDRINHYLTGEISASASGFSKSLEDEESHDEEEYEDEHSDDDDAEEVTLPTHAAVISAEVLHDLPPVPASRDLVAGELEFECVEDDEASEIFALWSGAILHDDSIVRVCRAGKTVDLWTFDGLKLSFEFKKLNKEWKSAFADRVVYMVD
jgi:hypothetical protein